MKNYISNCCGAELYDASLVCPECMEPCAAELVDEDAALDAQDLANTPKEGDFTAYFNHEQLL